MANFTRNYEEMVRGELLDSIEAHVDLSLDVPEFFVEEFGVEAKNEFYTMPISRLQEIADRIESVFC